MDQPENPDRTPEDVLSMGEGRSPRWGLLGALLAVLLLGIGAYQLVSRPSTPAAPGPAAAAAQEDTSAALVGSGRSGPEREGTASATTVRLGRETVALSGPGVAQARRETSASALGRVRHGWLVRLTSKACEGRPDTQVAYGVARASGRFALWQSRSTDRGTTWRSPDQTLLLVEEGPRLEVRRASTGRVLYDFGAGA